MSNFKLSFKGFSRSIFLSTLKASIRSAVCLLSAIHLLSIGLRGGLRNWDIFIYYCSHTTTVACNFRERYYIFSWPYMDIALQIFPNLSKIVPNSVPLTLCIITSYSIRYSHFSCELHRNCIKSGSMQLKRYNMID